MGFLPLRSFTFNKVPKCCHRDEPTIRWMKFIPASRYGRPILGFWASTLAESPILLTNRSPFRTGNSLGVYPSKVYSPPTLISRGDLLSHALTAIT
jgi:hypothetical protein